MLLMTDHCFRRQLIALTGEGEVVIFLSFKVYFLFRSLIRLSRCIPDTLEGLHASRPPPANRNSLSVHPSIFERLHPVRLQRQWLLAEKRWQSAARTSHSDQRIPKKAQRGCRIITCNAVNTFLCTTLLSVIL